MIKKKICMLGSFAVGKTSLIRQFVEGVFSEEYLTTLGVKIDKKTISIDSKEISLLLWDVHGSDEIQQINSSYLRGASGYFLVADSTRKKTCQKVFELKDLADQVIPNTPFFVLLNKTDLKDLRADISQELIEYNSRNWQVVDTSAKTGLGVSDAFIKLAGRLIDPKTIN